jgi:hypothetical protein
MVMEFTKEELKYIIVEKWKWRISDDCPENIRPQLQIKIDNLNRHIERRKQ